MGRRIYIPTILLLVIQPATIVILHAQVMIDFTQAPSSLTTYPDLWNLSLNNAGQPGAQVFIEIKVSEQKQGDIYTARTQNLSLNAGLTLFSVESFRIASQLYANSDMGSRFRTTGQFAEGLYTVCASVKNAWDETILNQKCQSFSVTQESLQQAGQLSTAGENKNFSIHGYAEVTGYYTNRPANYSNLPGSYAQMIFNPTLTIMEVPVGGRLTLSTLQSSTMQNINTFSLYFDGDQFKAMLKKKLMALVEKNNKLKDLNLSSLSGSMSQLKNIENTLKNPDVMGELSKIKELDSLKNIYNQLKSGNLDQLKTIGLDSLQQNKTLNSWKDSLMRKGEEVGDSLMSIKDSLMHTGERIQDSVQKYMAYKDSVQQYMDMLNGKIESMKWLEQKIPGYQKLLAQRDKLTELGKKFGLIDSNGQMKDLSSLKETLDYNKLSDPNFLYSKLRNSKLLRKADKILYGFKTFSIGLSQPQFSDLSLKNMPVNGILVEYELKNFYAGFTYGDLQSAAPTYNLNQASYRRRVVGGSFGYGRKEKTHIHFNIISAEDDTASIHPRDSVFIYQKTPGRNYVISADFKVLLFKERLRISGELAGSQTTRDYTFNDSSLINPVTTHDPDEWFANIMAQRTVNLSTAVDFAFNAKIEGVLFKGKTIISASTRRVGNNFYAFGTPFLMRDVFSVEGRVTQKLWKNRISLMAFFRRNNDNLDSTKLMESVFYNYGFDVGITIPKLPYFRASLMPVNLQNDSARFDMTVLNISSGYNYSIARHIIGATNLNYTWQQTSARDSFFTSMGHFVTLNQLFTFNKNITLNVTSSYFNIENDSLTKHVFNIGAGTGFTVFKKLNTSVGGNIYVANTELKWGAYLQMGVQFLKIFSLQVRMESNQFNNYLTQVYNPDYLQFMGRGILSARW